ncbi:MAG: hypothetical protein ACWGQW_16310 [bacterium]
MMFDQRGNDRFEYSDERIEYAFSPFAVDETYEATVVNFSRAGICILSSQELVVDQEISIRDFMSRPTISAKVIWVEKFVDRKFYDKGGEALYKVGLSFIP